MGHMWDVLLPAGFFFLPFFKVRVKGFSASGPSLNPIDPPALFLTYLLLVLTPLGAATFYAY